MDIIYDTECYPNFWCLVAIFAETDDVYIFEISNRRNDVARLFEFFNWIKYHKHRMVGYNSIGYDYSMIHFLMINAGLEFCDNAKITNLMFQQNEYLFSIPWGQKYLSVIPVYKRLIPQLDLFKIHHFNNKNKMTSLKMLEINMRAKRVVDLPFPPGTTVTREEMQVLIDYCIYDTEQTKEFYKKTLSMIEFREKLTVKYDRDFINHNDTKIGKDFLVMELEKRLGSESCYSKRPKKPKQTIRGSMKLGELIFPEIKFRTKEFNDILKFFRKTETSETKGVFKDLSCTFPNGLKCVFGMGGVHAFIKPMYVASCSKYAIIDLDVEGYYGSLTVSKRLFPAHLSEVFCDIMDELKIQRKQYTKGEPENAMLKLSINGAWGASNDQYSPFYDKKFAMQVTINGQLLLCMFAEMMMLIPDTTILQMNTDGLTIKIPRTLEAMLMSYKKKWEKFTGLILEYQYYTDVFLKNVNSYLAVDVMGNIKRKKDYDYEMKVGGNIAWNKNFSMLVVPKAAETHLIRGVNISEFIHNHDNNFDFCLSVKANKTQKLMWGDEEIQKTTRYYVSKIGKSLVQINSELPKTTRKKQEILNNELLAGRDGSGLFKLTKSGDPQPLTPVNRKIGINVGRVVTICNDGIMDRSNIDYDFYIQEVKKLTDPFEGY